MDWGELGKNAFGGVHTAGKVLATGFGGKAGANLADTSEQLETQGGLLPDWAKSAPKSQATPTAKPTQKPSSASTPSSTQGVMQSVSLPSGIAPSVPSWIKKNPGATVAVAAGAVTLLALLVHFLRRSK